MLRTSHNLVGGSIRRKHPKPVPKTVGPAHLAVLLAVIPGCFLVGCGHGSGSGTTSTGVVVTTTGLGSSGRITGKVPSGAVGPPDTAEEKAEGPAATEAAPEAPAEGPRSSGELSGGNRDSAVATVSDYVRALDRHDAARVCALLAPGSLDLTQLPRRRGGCRTSLRASIETAPRDGGPAWRKTTLFEAKTEDLGDGRARVSATVTHHFADRKYVSVEDDVIYLERAGSRWRLAKPSGTLYRAVGYSTPPLDALRSPAGW